MARNYISIHSDFFSEIERLDPERIAALVFALIAQVRGEGPPPLDGETAQLARLMEAQTKRMAERRSENGKKGGGQPGNQNAKALPEDGQSEQNGQSEKNEQNEQNGQSGQNELTTSTSTSSATATSSAKDRVPSDSPAGNRPPKGGSPPPGREDIGNSSRPSRTQRFHPPATQEVALYCAERKNGLDAESFCDYYAARGWRLSAGPMKDWRAAVRTWENYDKKDGTQQWGGRPAGPGTGTKQTAIKYKNYDAEFRYD